MQTAEYATKPGRTTSEARLAELVDRLIEYACRPNAGHAAGLCGAGELMNGLAAAILACESDGVPGRRIGEIVAPARDIHGRSPFVRRMQTWPRGYPGDYETIELILAWRVDAVPETPEWFIERVALASAMAQQHRNKVLWQAARVSQLVRRRSALGKATRILSVACGASPDLRMIQHELQFYDCTIVLNDLDRAALDTSVRLLDRLRERTRIVGGSVFEAMSALRARGPYDVVLAGGLADYLSDRHLLALASQVRRRLLSPEGIFLVTNIARDNPHRGWLQYVADWHLIERSEADVARTLGTAGFEPAHVSLARDGTGLSLLIAAGAADSNQRSDG